MLYFVGTLQDKTEVTCSHIMVREGKETIEVYFERPIYGGFDSARCILPDCKWKFIEGYSSQEIRKFESYMQQWEPQMFRLARYGERRMESIMEEGSFHGDLTDNEKIDMAAREILRRYRPAFKELAK